MTKCVTKRQNTQKQVFPKDVKARKVLQYVKTKHISCHMNKEKMTVACVIQVDKGYITE